MEIKTVIKSHVEANIALSQSLLASQSLEQAAIFCEVIIQALTSGRKILLAGNGGSAADAQHIAAEFVNFFRVPRRALPAIALTVDSSVITSISNDSEFENVFARQVEALGSEGDILWLYSTSGKSPNILRAGRAGRAAKMSVASFVGDFTEEVEPFSDFILSVPSSDTPRIQEAHLVLGHAISELVENAITQK